MAAKRPNQQRSCRLRSLKLTLGTMKFAGASCLVELGHTKVICTASVENRVPNFLRDSKTGWITSEYGMLPGSSKERIQRESIRGRPQGRTQEIQRLIGRSLRSVTDLARLGERSIIIDCDVLQADGGTRCAGITGGFVALVEILRRMRREGVLPVVPVRDFVAAVSVGIVSGKPLLDLSYAEDASADVDMNVVMTGRGELVEIQATAERSPFSASDLTKLLTLAKSGIKRILAAQRDVLRASSAKKW